MNVLVCVKQVPDTIKVRFDSEGYHLLRNEGPMVINPFDLYAVEAAACLKDKYEDCHIVALTMGPETAKSVLRDALAIACDEAYLLSDERLMGSDVSVTVSSISSAIDKIEEKEGKFDAVFCGAKTTDGGTSSFAIELAGYRGLPVLSYALTCEREGEGLRVWQECDEAKHIFNIPFPCVVSFTKATFPTRYPLLSRVLAADSQEIIVYTLDDIPGGLLSEEKNGLDKSLSLVKSQKYRELKKVSRFIKDKNPENGARKLARVLSEAHII